MARCGTNQTARGQMDKIPPQYDIISNPYREFTVEEITEYVEIFRSQGMTDNEIILFFEKLLAEVKSEDLALS